MISRHQKKYVTIAVTALLIVTFLQSLYIFDYAIVSTLNNSLISQAHEEVGRDLFFDLAEDWTITTHVQIDNQVIFINSDIIIYEGGALILNNSSLIFISSDLKNKIEVTTGGKLQLENNSKITSGLNENNYYIKIDSNGTFYSNNSEVSYAGFAFGFDYTKSGVWINSDNVTIENTYFKWNYMGIYLENISNIEISNCSFYGNYIGTYIFHSSNISIVNNSISKSKDLGLIIQASKDIKINTTTINDNSGEILVTDSYDIAFYDNHIESNGKGIRFESITGLMLGNNQVTRNGDGVNIRNSSKIDIRENEITQNNGFAIYLISSLNCTLVKNSLASNQHGVSFEGSLNLEVVNNTLLNDSFVFVNYTKETFTTVYFNSSNVINGLPIYMIYNVNNSEIHNLTAGQLFVMFSNNITITSSNVMGIEIYKASEIIVNDSSTSKSDYGAYIRRSYNVTLSKSYFEDNYIGIYLAFDNTTHIHNNTIRNNYHYGIFHKQSNNTIAYMNFFLDNAYHIHDDTAIFWDNTTIGNYWDDYTGIDKNNDGIGDVPYTIDSDSEDRFPIVLPDTLNPEINSISQYPKNPNELDDVSIEANITDNVGVKVVILSFTNGSTWINVSMIWDANKKLYIGTIEKQENGTAIKYMIYASDYAENWIASNLYQYTVEYHELEPPIIHSITQSPENPTDKNTVEINANITDNTEVTLVILQYSVNNNIWQNVTMQYNCTKKVFVEVIPEQNVSTIITYRIIATDKYNNSIISIANTYTVLPADVNNPMYQEVLISPAEPTEKDEVIVQANITDESDILFVVLLYSVNQKTWSNLTMSLNESTGLYSAIIPRQQIRDNVSFYLIAQDLYENVGISKIFYYSVRPSDKSGPTISNVEYFPVNPTEQNSVTVTAVITDESNVSLAILSFYNGTAWKNTTMQYNTTAKKYEGVIPKMALSKIIMFRVYANDSLGNLSISKTYTYKVQQSNNAESKNIFYVLAGVITFIGVIISIAMMYYYGYHPRSSTKQLKHSHRTYFNSDRKISLVPKVFNA